MRRLLKILYIPICVILFFAFHILYVKNIVPYGYINIVLLAIAPSGFIYKRRLPLILIVAVFSILYPSCILIYNIEPLNAALPILIFGSLAIGFSVYKNLIEEKKSEWSSISRKKEDARRKSQEEFETLELLESDVRDKELAVIRLYEITKKMSGGLKFENIFDIFTSCLRENFIFRRSELLVLKDSEGALRIDKTYSVWGEGGEEAPQSSVGMAHGEILNLLLEDKKELYLMRERDRAIFKKLGIGEGVDSFVLMPLLSENKMAGILTIENLSYIDLGRFAILAAQFALELKKVQLYEKVEELAITDSLTGLYVRRHFFERLDEELARSERYKLKFAYLMIDIDNFKNINDTYGHLVGDCILRDVGRILKENTREIDLDARYGGEEFSLVLPEAEREEARLVGERIRKKVEENVFSAYDEKLHVTISAGISTYPDDSADIKGLAEKADKALYAAKKSGKNIVYMYKKGYNS